MGNKQSSSPPGTLEISSASSQSRRSLSPIPSGKTKSSDSKKSTVRRVVSTGCQSMDRSDNAAVRSPTRGWGSASLPAKLRNKAKSVLPARGRKQGRTDLELSDIDKDLDQIILFIQRAQKTSAGKKNLESIVVSKLAKPADSPSTELFLRENQLSPNPQRPKSCHRRVKIPGSSRGKVSDPPRLKTMATCPTE